MFRVEKDSDGCFTKLTLMSRIQSNHIAFVRLAMNDGFSHVKASRAPRI